MKRTQFYLDDDLDARLRDAAASDGRSAAALVREAITEYLAHRRPRRPADPLAELIGAFSGGSEDGAENHDAYLYGRRDRR